MEKKNEIVEDEELIETAAPESQEPREKTRLQRFVEKLRVYSTAEEAKTHIKEIATEIGCATSLGYKAVKNIMKQGGFSGQPAPKTEAKEPTAKIEEVTPETLEETQETEFEETAETAAAPETPQAAAAFLDKDMSWMFEKGFKMLADLSGYEGFKLDPDDSKRLGEIWTPIINQHLTDILPYSPIIVASITTIVIVVPKVKGWWSYRSKKKKAEKPLPEPPKQEPPKPEPPTMPQAADDKTPPPLEAGIVAAVEKENQKPTTAPFMKNL